jgi:hypothetical protein
MQYISRPDQLADSVLHCWQTIIASINGHYYVSLGRICRFHGSIEAELKGAGWFV